MIRRKWNTVKFWSEKNETNRLHKSPINKTARKRQKYSKFLLLVIIFRADVTVQLRQKTKCEKCSRRFNWNKSLYRFVPQLQSQYLGFQLLLSCPVLKLREDHRSTVAEKHLWGWSWFSFVLSTSRNAGNWWSCVTVVVHRFNLVWFRFDFTKCENMCP